MIPVKEDWQIVIEPKTIVLQQKKVKGGDEQSRSRLLDASTAGEEYWSDVGYFTDIEGALKQFTQSELSKAKDLNELREKLAEIKSCIKNVNKLLEVC